ncbi:MAG: hypothetical protein AAGD92_03280 [Pseudomonadota bacterium]
MTPEYLEHQRVLTDGPYKELELEAAHWLVQKHPETISASVLSHMARQ